ncbi:Hypothetical predicted protein, partial [Xyrichtys novacula]
MESWKACFLCLSCRGAGWNKLIIKFDSENCLISRITKCPVSSASPAGNAEWQVLNNSARVRSVAKESGGGCLSEEKEASREKRNSSITVRNRTTDTEEQQEEEKKKKNRGRREEKSECEEKMNYSNSCPWERGRKSKGVDVDGCAEQNGLLGAGSTPPSRFQRPRLSVTGHSQGDLLFYNTRASTGHGSLCVELEAPSVAEWSHSMSRHWTSATLSFKRTRGPPIPG